MNTKAILVSTLFTALIAGTSAFAGDNSYLFEDDSYSTATESVEIQKVNIVTPATTDLGLFDKDSNR